MPNACNDSSAAKQTPPAPRTCLFNPLDGALVAHFGVVEIFWRHGRGWIEGKLFAFGGHEECPSNVSQVRTHINRKACCPAPLTRTDQSDGQADEIRRKHRGKHRQMAEGVGTNGKLGKLPEEGTRGE